MKTMIAIAAVILGTVAVVPAAWADTLAPLEINHASTEPQATTGEPVPQPTSQQLDRLETRINQDVDGDRRPNRPQTPLSNLGEVLSLPEGVVVRGTRGGGLAIGGEF
jgi:hypothetical protein